MKIYVGCAIVTDAPNLSDTVDDLKTRLAEAGHEVLYFVGSDREATARDVYQKDIACASEADLMIAIADVPSSGMGMEVQKRIDMQKPVIICHRASSHVSRMLHGAAEVYDFVSVVTYDTVEDILKMVQKI